MNQQLSANIQRKNTKGIEMQNTNKTARISSHFENFRIINPERREKHKLLSHSEKPKLKNEYE